MTRPAALSVEKLSFRFGKKAALDRVSFAIEAGSTVILLGPNGAGKTTLFSLICGLFAPREGGIVIAGIDANKDRPASLAPLGVVFQAQTLDLDLTVRQNLRYFCALRGIAQVEADRIIDQELTRLDMATRIDEKVRALNGGHRRRVEIARAALHKPSILLLDEPTNGLDIPTRKALINYLHERPAADGAAVLWATHLIDEIRDSDRVLVLHQGRLVADGRPSALIEMTGTGDLSEAFSKLTAQPAGHEANS